MAESVSVAFGVCGADTGGERPECSDPELMVAVLQRFSYVDLEAVVPLDLILAHLQALC